MTATLVPPPPPEDEDINEMYIRLGGRLEFKPVPMFESYYESIRDFLGNDEPTEEEDDAQWLVKGMLARAAPTIFVGGPKAAKTLIAMHLALCMARGLPWLGVPTTGQRVLFLAHEDPKVETRRRIWRLARGLGFDPRELESKLVVRDRVVPFRFDDPADWKRMETTLRLLKPDVVFFDSLSRIHRKDENSASEMRLITDVWMEIANKYNVTPCILHHTNKTTDGVRGSGEIFAAARHKVSFTKKGEIVHLATDGNLSYQPEPFALLVRDAEVDGHKAVLVERTTAAEPGSDRDDNGPGPADADLDQSIIQVMRAASKRLFFGEVIEALRAAGKGTREARVRARLAVLSATGVVSRLSPRHPYLLMGMPLPL